MLLVSYLKSHCQAQDHLGFLLWVLSSRSFIALCFTIRSLIHLGLNLWKVWSLCLDSLSCIWMASCASTIVEKTVVAPLYCLYQRSIDDTFVSLFQGTLFYSCLSRNLPRLPSLWLHLFHKIAQSFTLIFPVSLYLHLLLS